MVLLVSSGKSSDPYSSHDFIIFFVKHLVGDHPPNKRDFVLSGGVPYSLSALSVHMNDLDISQQGFAVLLCVLSPDSNSKINLSTVRDMALNHNIVNICRLSRFKHSECPQIEAMTSHILNITAAQWS
jgi:hypothetical protein